MKVVLVGHPSSQVIVPASKYLTSKYMPGFEFIYLNYEGDIYGWSKYLAEFLLSVTDDHVIVALDDYLVADHINMHLFEEALAIAQSDGIVCVKLCECTSDEQEEYPVTTQYTIWDRLLLVHILMQVTTPWEFELKGSLFLKTELAGMKAVVHTCLNYFTNSSLSPRWEGIRLEGLKEEDINYMKANGLLPNQ